MPVGRMHDPPNPGIVRGPAPKYARLGRMGMDDVEFFMENGIRKTEKGGDILQGMNVADQRLYEPAGNAALTDECRDHAMRQKGS